VLLSALILAWLATSSSSLPFISPKLLLLEQGFGKWWALATDAFCSASGQLLARNLFLGYMFGRVVENTESSGALWLTYLLGSAGGARCHISSDSKQWGALSLALCCNCKVTGLPTRC
jgi:membrane associated rhomboid family serine protease